MDEELLILSLRRILQFLAVGCVFAAAFFTAWPRAWTQKANDKMTKWHSTKKLEEKLDLAVYIDSQFLRMRKFLALISIALALILIFLCFKY